MQVGGMQSTKENDMDAVSYIRERARMCKETKNCGECPLIGGGCGSNLKMSPKKILAIVEQWSKEHPLVTNGDKVMEIIKDTGVPVTARGSGFDREVPVNTVHIAVSEDWWNAEYKE